MSPGELLAERGLRDSGRYKRDRAYWLRGIDELPPAPELPIREAPSDVTRFERHEVTLGTSERNALHRRAGRHALTSRGIILAAYAEVIGMWSRRPVFTLNLMMPSRFPRHPDLDRFVEDVTSVTLPPLTGWTRWPSPVRPAVQAGRPRVRHLQRRLDQPTQRSDDHSLRRGQHRRRHQHALRDQLPGPGTRTRQYRLRPFGLRHLWGCWAPAGHWCCPAPSAEWIPRTGSG